jgi:hypothetical protein
MARQYGELIMLAVGRRLSVLTGWGGGYDIGRYQIKQEGTEYNELK